MLSDISVTSPEKITRTHIFDYLSHLAGLGRSGVTIVYFEKKATLALRAYHANRSQSKDQNVFLNYQGNGLSVRGVIDIVEKNRKLAGISKKFSCHSLRHTCAT